MGSVPAAPERNKIKILGEFEYKDGDGPHVVDYNPEIVGHPVPIPVVVFTSFDIGSGMEGFIQPLHSQPTQLSGDYSQVTLQADLRSRSQSCRMQYFLLPHGFPGVLTGLVIFEGGSGGEQRREIKFTEAIQNGGGVAGFAPFQEPPSKYNGWPLFNLNVPH